MGYAFTLLHGNHHTAFVPNGQERARAPFSWSFPFLPALSSSSTSSLALFSLSALLLDRPAPSFLSYV
jgi:hypothetical protein